MRQIIIRALSIIRIFYRIFDKLIRFPQWHRLSKGLYVVIGIWIMSEPNSRVKLSEEMTRALTVITPATQLIVNGFIHGTHDPLTPLKLALAALSSWRVRPITSKLLIVWGRVCQHAIARVRKLHPAGTNTPPTTTTTRTTMMMNGIEKVTSI